MGRADLPLTDATLVELAQAFLTAQFDMSEFLAGCARRRRRSWPASWLHLVVADDLFRTWIRPVLVYAWPERARAVLGERFDAESAVAVGAAEGGAEAHAAPPSCQGCTAHVRQGHGPWTKPT